MNLLVVETATTVCGVAYFVNNVLIAVKEVNEAKVHAEILPVYIDEMIKEHQIDLSSLDALAISAGPGSYTGLRIGMSLVKGLALAAQLPILSVPTLAALNSGIHDSKKHYTGIHSHKDLVFVQEFEGRKSMGEPVCIRYDQLIQQPLYGFGLEKILEKSQFTEVIPSAVAVGETARFIGIQHAQKDLNLVNPQYLTEFNLRK